MNIPYRLVVFDWEGTLGDVLGEILAVLKVEAEKLNFGALDVTTAKNFIDLGLTNIIKKAFPSLSLHDHLHLLNAVQLKVSTKKSKICLIPGAMSFVKKLARNNVAMGIASNRAHFSLQRVVQLSGIGKWIKEIRSVDDSPPKPNPQMLKEIMKVFNALPHETVMIGDSTTDIEMAQQLNVAAIGMDHYHQQDQALKSAGALIVCKDFWAVADFLNIPLKKRV